MKLYAKWFGATAAAWFSIFRLNPFDNRVYCRIVVRIVQFWRST